MSEIETTGEDRLLPLLEAASSIITSWRSCAILAVEAERQLLDLGFYNISFRGLKVRGAWNGNEFQLEE